ncbi:hypothetical protein B0T22DRAFT_46452 [Podospora appendiculata]|uniref:Apple domain-containing protein n=1 Tax=Podospora appendiculata TaxID=314037 RepID=A0AAE1CGP1_9PEZI|nr:hypothetical protein B0T22DRAFT_46452 [Podospora appendiculata]
MNDTKQVSAPDSQQASAVRYSRHSHDAPEVVQRPYLPEKPAELTQQSPRVDQQQNYNYWPHSEAVPPRYPSSSGEDPPELLVPPVEPLAEPRICGIRRGLVLLLVALGGLIMMGVAVGVGVGVGIGNQNRNTAAPSTEAESTSSLPLAATPSPTATYSASPTGTLCPDVANVQFAAPKNKIFLHVCGIDYSGRGEAHDLANEKTSTFEDCLTQCAMMSQCTGAGWGPMDGDSGNVHTCWMKNQLNKSHIATPDWNFGVLLASDVSGNSSAF